MDIFQYSFMQKSLLAGIFISIISSIIGIYILLRGITFMGAGISHAVFGGLALGYLLNINMTLTSIIFTILIIISMPYITKRSKLKADVPIGIYFSSSMALGALLLSFRKGYTTDLFSFLFGSILSVGDQDLFLTILFAVFLLLFFYKNYWKILFIIFDEESAKASGINTSRLETYILILTGIAIVLISKLVGIILSSALIIIPVATLIPFIKDIKKLAIYTILFTFLNILIGLIISYYFDTPSGSTIVMLGTLIFLISLFFTKK
jgi:zinc transport system permease protein